MKKILLYLAILSAPINVFAYSSEVILGGQTIGIDVESDGVLIVGFYKINGSFNTANPKILEGDYIISVNGENISDIDDLTETIDKYKTDESVELLVRRGEEEFTTTLDLISDDGSYKTGFYVKDSITGIGTLTFIDPANMVYGALGHEIIESNTSTILEVDSGTIFENSIISIDKSSAGDPGSKNATFYYDNTYGDVLTNTNKGIYGNYTSSVSDYDLIEVAEKSEVEVGPALIYTVTEDETVETYNINITKINESGDTKNLTIEIVDEDLLELTGGVVQGMSGSPIIQNDKLVGAVTNVIVDNPTTGYGIFIENMLDVSDSITE